MPRTAAPVEEFDPRRVRPLPGQPRKRFRGIRELAASIAEVGQLAPGIVTRVDGNDAITTRSSSTASAA
jgi:ParB-like chromosome segregation protein Spo0J